MDSKVVGLRRVTNRQRSEFWIRFFSTDMKSPQDSVIDAKKKVGRDTTRKIVGCQCVSNWSILFLLLPRTIESKHPLPISYTPPWESKVNGSLSLSPPLSPCNRVAFPLRGDISCFLHSSIRLFYYGKRERKQNAAVVKKAKKDVTVPRGWERKKLERERDWWLLSCYSSLCRGKRERKRIQKMGK